MQDFRAASADGALIHAIAGLLVLGEAGVRHGAVGGGEFSTQSDGADLALAGLLAGRAGRELVIGHALEHLEAAKALGVKTVAITAVEGGKMRGMADEGVHVPTENKEYGPAEDAHLILNHLIGAYLMRVIKAS